MKPAWKLLIGLYFVLHFVNGFSQKREEPAPEKKFLFNTEKVQLSTFFFELSPGTYFSKLNGQLVSTAVASGGFILNDRFSISFFSASSPKVNLISIPENGTAEYDEWTDAGVDLDKLNSDQELVYVDFKHSGLKFNYLHKTDNILFWRTGISFGFLGGLTLSGDDTFMGLFNNVIYDEKVITLEPEFGLGVNLLPWWRAHIDLGYRFMSADTRIMGSADADSFTLNLGFAFGKFAR